MCKLNKKSEEHVNYQSIQSRVTNEQQEHLLEGLSLQVTIHQLTIQNKPYFFSFFFFNIYVDSRNVKCMDHSIFFSP